MVLWILQLCPQKLFHRIKYRRYLDVMFVLTRPVYKRQFKISNLLPPVILHCVPVYMLILNMLGPVSAKPSIPTVSGFRPAALTNPEDLVNVGSPLRDASPRPEVRVVAPSHRPPPALAAANATNVSNGSANRKSVSILLPEHSSGWPQQQHGFVHRCDKEPPSI